MKKRAKRFDAALPRLLNGFMAAFAIMASQPTAAREADVHLFLVWEHAADDSPLFGYCDEKGRMVIDFSFKEAYSFHEGLARVRIGGQWCFIRSSGTVAFRLPKDFADASEFSDGIARVNRGGTFNVDMIDGGTWGYIDATGRPVAWFNVLTRGDPPLYSFHDGHAPIKIGAKWGFYDKKFEPRIEPKYDAVRDFSEGCAAVRLGTEWRYIDGNGAPAVPGSYDAAGSFSDGLAPVTHGKKHAFIDKAGRMAFQFDDEWGEDSRFSEGLAPLSLRPHGHVPVGAVCTICGEVVSGHDFGDACPGCGLPIGEARCGYVNKKGTVEIAPTFAECKPFSEGLAAVRQRSGGPWGFVDKTGRIVIPCQFSAVAEGFSGGLCEVLTPLADTRVVDGVSINEPLPCDALIDRSGRFVWRSPNLVETEKEKRERGR